MIFGMNFLYFSDLTLQDITLPSSLKTTIFVIPERLERPYVESTFRVL